MVICNILIGNQYLTLSIIVDNKNEYQNIYSTITFLLYQITHWMLQICSF